MHILSKHLAITTEGKQTASLVQENRRPEGSRPCPMPRISKFSRQAMPQVEYYYSFQIMRDGKTDQVRGREGEKPRGTRVPLQLQNFIRQQDFLPGRHKKNNPNSNLLWQWKWKEKSLLWVKSTAVSLTYQPTRAQTQCLTQGLTEVGDWGSRYRRFGALGLASVILQHLVKLTCL